MDFLNGYRQQRISEEVLAERDDWDADSCAELQRDTRSLVTFDVGDWEGCRYALAF